MITDIDEDKFDPATFIMTDEGIQDEDDEEEDAWGYDDDDFDGDFDYDDDDLEDGEEDDWGPVCPLDELADDQLCGEDYEDEDEDCPLPVGEWDENPLNKFDVADRFDESRLADDGFIDQYLGEYDEDDNS